MQASVKQASNRFIIFFIVLFYVLCLLIRIEGPIYSIDPSKKEYPMLFALVPDIATEYSQTFHGNSG